MLVAEAELDKAILREAASGKSLSSGVIPGMLQLSFSPGTVSTYFACAAVTVESSAITELCFLYPNQPLRRSRFHGLRKMHSTINFALVSLGATRRQHEVGFFCSRGACDQIEDRYPRRLRAKRKHLPGPFHT